MGPAPAQDRQKLDLGKENQMVLELRPAHDPAKTYGFVGVVSSLKDLSASIWLWIGQRRMGDQEGDRDSGGTSRSRSLPPALKDSKPCRRS